VTARPDRQQGLGRGLAALIPQRPNTAGSVEIPIARIRPNPRQPRQRIGQTELETLAASIVAHGVLQPILVIETIDGYQLVAGERRLRASQLAGLDRIPAIIRQLADRDQLELALVENLQREDLGPLEEANAFRSLVDDFGMSQEEIATRVGRARSTVANTLRLLELDERVQAALSEGSISEGHARALGGLAADQQARVVPTVVDQALSVRQTEELVRRLREPRRIAADAAPRRLEPELEQLEEELRRSLGTKVTLARSRRGGRIVIEYYSDEELSQLYERLIGGRA
jgi:ParB family transcriptional regulator, chromosome partitioning protein